MARETHPRPDDEAIPRPAGTPEGAAVPAGGPPSAPDDAAIRRELGIGGSRGAIDPEEVERLLRGALVGYGEVFSGELEASAAEPGGIAHAIPAAGAALVDQNLELLRDVHLQVRVELGRGRMVLEDILRIGPGSVVELERLAGDPLDITVNDKVIARGEVLVLDENFCIRITQVFHPEEIRQGV